MNILDRDVLLLNKVWLPIGIRNVKQSIVSMCGNGDGVVPACGLNIEYEQKSNGEYDFNKIFQIYPCNWEEWIKLPIRPFDLVLNSPLLRIRVPTVIIANNYNKVPIKRLRPSKSAILLRDNFQCQYTGKKLSKKQATIDHILPKNKNGKDEWTNLVCCDKDINFKKGNKLNHEIGLKLIREPKAPLPIPVSLLIREAKHHDWKHFLTHLKD